ncbi:unnamed protein product [Knipowitschia caucasica]
MSYKIPKRTRSDSDSPQMKSPLSRLNTQNQSPPLVRRPGDGHSSFRGKTRTEAFTNGWRPKRASDRLLSAAPGPDVEHESCLDSPPDTESDSTVIAVRSQDALFRLRAERHLGSCPDRKCPQKPPNKDTSVLSWSKLSSASSPLDSNGVWSELSDVREKQRDKWRQFKEKKQLRTYASRRNRDQARPDQARPDQARPDQARPDQARPDQARPDQTQGQSRSYKRTTANSEPIVLSSEEEEDEQSDGQSEQVPLPFLQLDFCSFHMGLSRAEANGKVTISESGITVPLTGPGPDSGSVELSIVASQMRSFGLWDGGVARGGALFSDNSGPAPSLLFLWISDVQSQLLKKELHEIHQSTDPLCPLVLLVLQSQLSDLDSALVSSILDSGDYLKSRSGSGPVDWTQGLVLIHTCPAPVDSHLLQLLGPMSASDPPPRSPALRTRTRSGSQKLPSRLIQYPAAPSRGRISVSSEDLLCLKHGEFLNDVIIDFYLK